MKLLTSKLVGCIITYNEEVHIERSLKSLYRLGISVLVIDSFSTDETVSIAERLGAHVIKHRFVDFGSQRTFAISEASELGYGWMLFLDADEYLTDELVFEIKSLQCDHTVGYFLKRRFVWNGKWIKHGGYYPTKLLRLFNLDNAVVTRQINEHIQVQGIIKELRHDFVDENLNGIEFWVDKHNRYSSLEAESWIHGKDKVLNNGLKILRRFPLLLQPFIYFFYRVLIRGGFRDGLHAIWYHYLHAFIMFGLSSYKYKINRDVRNSRVHK